MSTLSEFERGCLVERERVTRIIRGLVFLGGSADYVAALDELLVALGVEDTKSAVNEEGA